MISFRRLLSPSLHWIKINARNLYLEIGKDPAHSRFLLYYGRNLGDYVPFTMPNYKHLLSHQDFDIDKKTVLYIHGYYENPTKLSARIIIDAYRKRSDINFVFLDWSEMAYGRHFWEAIPNIELVGEEVARVLIEIFECGFDINLLHIVGHHMGGQLAGIIGRTVKKLSNYKRRIKRISALDPPHPLLYLIGIAGILTRSDADFVDIIHTDAWSYGFPFSTGTADFWPNGGKFGMPGVTKRNYIFLSKIDLASHNRSWWYWAESVALDFPEFEAVRAKSWSDFKRGITLRRPYEPRAIMGHKCPTNILGDFFLQTNGSPPYARGTPGIHYVHPTQLHYA